MEAVVSPLFVACQEYLPVFFENQILGLCLFVRHSQREPMMLNLEIRKKDTRLKATYQQI